MVPELCHPKPVIGGKEAGFEATCMWRDIIELARKAGIPLIVLTVYVVVGLGGCASQATPTGSTGPVASRLKEGTLLLYLSGPSPSRTPPQGAVGYTNWGFQLNGFNRTTSFIIYEAGYQGAFSVSSSCPSTPDAVAAATFSPDAMGPGAILVVTSGRVYSTTTCIFSISDVLLRPYMSASATRDSSRPELG